MQTHPDISLVIGDLLQLARFWLCSDSMNIPPPTILTFRSFASTMLHQSTEDDYNSLIYIGTKTSMNFVKLDL